MSLRNKIELKQEDRERFVELQKWLFARRDEILAAPPYTDTAFWCDYCERDFEGKGHKEVRVPVGSVWLAYYVGICPCGKHSLRYITDKLKDPYFYKSLTVRVQQRLFPDEMLQPWQPRFKLLYPQQYQKLYLQEQGIALS